MGLAAGGRAHPESRARIQRFRREFDIVIKATRTERIAHLLGIQLPEAGPVTISGRFSCSDQKSRLQGLKLRAGRSNRLLVDLAVNTGSEPWAALQVSAHDVEMGNALAQVQSKVPLEGSLNLFIDLRGEGRSPHEIASSLGGDFGIAVENLTLPRRELDLFAVDFLGWAVSRTVAKDREVEIRCGIVRFSIKDGLAESQTLVADGPTLTLSGSGNLNLRDETVDFVLIPSKKRRFWASADPVTIKGPLTDPAVKPLPTGTAAIAGAAVVAPLIVIPVAAAGYLWNLLGEADDENSPCLDLKAQGLQPPTPR